jgi:AraC family transcriptional regulator
VNAAGFLPVLTHIQAHIADDLTLSELARRAGLSPAHFHRAFAAALDETPRAYVERMRLEQAAFRLLIHDATLIEIALDCGFRNHETFSRAFRRVFGLTPRDYRVQRRAAIAEGQAPRRRAEASPDACAHLSATKIVRLQPMTVAFIRHTGPYEEAPDTLFAELDRWARRRGVAGPRLWLGIGHDSPTVTPAHRLRFDAALAVDEPDVAVDGVAFQSLPGGTFAMTTHVGPFSALPDAYATIFSRLTAMPRLRIIGLPAREFYRTARVDAAFALNQTDIYLPVESAAAARD